MSDWSSQVATISEPNKSVSAIAVDASSNIYVAYATGLVKVPYCTVVYYITLYDAVSLSPLYFLSTVIFMIILWDINVLL